MRIDEIVQKHKGTFSFEIFPPKGEFNVDNVRTLLGELCAFKPDYMSVTYSAGGSANGTLTKEIAAMTEREYNVPCASHITCINSTRSEITSVIDALHEVGVTNVLALRGDKMEGCTAKDFSHATDILPMLLKKGFCIGGACYPEGHPSCPSLDKDVEYMRIKEDMGVSFFVSQLCFDNDYFRRFLAKTQSAGIKSPICAGVMPIMSKSQINRMIYMCAVSLPSAIIRILNKYENDAAGLTEAGLDFAAKQIAELMADGVDDVHFYTMNRTDIAAGLCERLAALGVRK